MQNANGNLDSKLLYPELTEKIIEIYYEVYNELGHGFLESVYSNCMYLALRSAGVCVHGRFRFPCISEAQMWSVQSRFDR
jgi:GxxExxY protein